MLTPQSPNHRHDIRTRQKDHNLGCLVMLSGEPKAIEAPLTPQSIVGVVD
ncbi:hypothetical protein IC229_31480 [Spirosoma sp. BT702]|uniref:Uncharacterized protein n=1 Tax=Spirosoma profusum TaxID=2771354 RepID=A0A927GA23_9BACT|nr:hypothetical protein [Spirosoma profusum]MBD2705186.1 hypothetical protein [Spirosoma profusum]